jgi:Uma2 family endonuclease
VPDVAVFLEGGTAQNRGSHWLGGPDFAVEVVSPDDRTREKISFCETVRTRELLIINRDPWALELLRRQGERLVMVGQATLDNPLELRAESLSLTFELLSASPRPGIRVNNHVSGQEWTL